MSLCLYVCVPFYDLRVGVSVLAPVCLSDCIRLNIFLKFCAVTVVYHPKLFSVVL